MSYGALLLRNELRAMAVVSSGLPLMQSLALGGGAGAWDIIMRKRTGRVTRLANADNARLAPNCISGSPVLYE